MTKVFTFGCSFTRWFWPSWSDVLAHSNPDLQVINLGLPGIGNWRIASRINEMSITDQMRPEDKLLVVWSTWNRRDIWIDGGWHHHGSVVDDGYAGPLDSEWVSRYHHQEHDALINYNAIHSTNTSHCVDYNGIVTEPPHPDSYVSNPDHKQRHLDMYHALPRTHSFTPIRGNRFGGVVTDAHPDIVAHASYYLYMTKVLPWLKRPDMKFFITMQGHVTDSYIAADRSRRDEWWYVQDMLADFSPWWKQRFDETRSHPEKFKLIS